MKKTTKQKKSNDYDAPPTFRRIEEEPNESPYVFKDQDVEQKKAQPHKLESMRGEMNDAFSKLEQKYGVKDNPANKYKLDDSASRVSDTLKKFEAISSVRDRLKKTSHHDLI